MRAFLILGNQLFDPGLVRQRIGLEVPVYMREDCGLCTYFRFHKHKIIFFLAAMRAYADELRASGIEVHYEELSPDTHPFEDHLVAWLKSKGITLLSCFEIEDKFFETRLLRRLKQEGITFEIVRSPMFLTSRSEFASYLAKHKKPFMRTFYEAQRKRLKLLVDRDQRPIGGAWSFDQENRLALPAAVVPPALPEIKDAPEHIQAAQELCRLHFGEHPGSEADFWLPVTRDGARKWLKEFTTKRLAGFGPYEDAIPSHSPFVFHSVLTPFLNTGLLTPHEVIKETLAEAKRSKLPLNSVEGFIRQVIGWREFVRGVYQNFSETQETKNFWKHQRKLKPIWYHGGTGVPPLDHALEKVFRYGYAHHIERLMVIGSMMLLLEVAPQEAHRWFMEMFIDSSDWVMGPNVYGMALFSDGGIFATKPYICGSNYYRKMGGYKKAEWCDAVDGLYWSFIDRNRAFFERNPRLSMTLRTLDKMEASKKIRLASAADQLRDKLVY